MQKHLFLSVFFGLMNFSTTVYALRIEKSFALEVNQRGQETRLYMPKISSQDPNYKFHHFLDLDLLRTSGIIQVALLVCYGNQRLSMHLAENSSVGAQSVGSIMVISTVGGMTFQNLNWLIERLPENLAKNLRHNISHNQEQFRRQMCSQEALDNLSKYLLNDQNIPNNSQIGRFILSWDSSGFFDPSKYLKIVAPGYGN